MNGLLLRYSKWVYKSPFHVVTLMALITIAFLAYLPKLEINPTPYFLDVSHPSRVAEHETKNTFSNTGETAIIALINKESIFNSKSLVDVQRVSEALEDLSLLESSDTDNLRELSGWGVSKAQIEDILESGLTRADLPKISKLRSSLVDAGGSGSLDSNVYHAALKLLDHIVVAIAPVVRVRSLSTYETLQSRTEGGEEVLEVDLLMREVPQSRKQLEELREKVRDNPMFIGLLVSDDERATTIQVELSISEDDSPMMVKAYSKIKETIDGLQIQDEVHLGGPPMVTSQITKSIDTDNMTLMPLVFTVVGVVLFLCFRSIQGVAIPLIIAFVATGWTISTMALLGVAQNIVTTMLPVFLVAIAVADAIHFLNTYYAESQLPEEAMERTLGILLYPLLVTSITTIVAFLIISRTHLVFLQEFGLFTALGISYAFILTVTLLPALLGIFDRRSAGAKKVTSNGLRVLNNWVANTVSKMCDRPKTTLLYIFMLLGVAGLMLPSLKIHNEVIGYFNADERIRVDEKIIREHFGGTTPLNLHFSSTKENAFKNPAVLAALDKIAADLVGMEYVGYASSLVDFVKFSNKTFSNTDYVIPRDANEAVIGQLLFLFENSRTQDLRDVTDLDYKEARIFLLLRSDNSALMSEIIERAKQLAKLYLPLHVSMNVNGFAEILVTSSDEIVNDQISHTLIAVASVLVVLVMLFRSLTLALIGIIPLVVTVYLTFVLMAAIDVPLNIGTSIVSCISIGVGIDYAIHFISMFVAKLKEHGNDTKDAIRAAVEHVTGAIVTNSAALTFGFLVLSFSSYAALVHLGWIVAAAMVICAVMTLALLPLIMTIIMGIKKSETVYPGYA